MNVYTHTELAQVPPKPSNAFSRHRDLARLGSVLFRQRSSKDPFAPRSLHPVLSCCTMKMAHDASESCFQKTHCPLVLAELGGHADPRLKTGNHSSTLLQTSSAPPPHWHLRCPFCEGAQLSRQHVEDPVPMWPQHPPSWHSPSRVTWAPAFSLPSPQQPLSSLP